MISIVKTISKLANKLRATSVLNPSTITVYDGQSVSLPSEIDDYDAISLYCAFENAAQTERLQRLYFDRNINTSIGYSLSTGGSTFIGVAFTVDWNNKTVLANYIVTSTYWTTSQPMLITKVVGEKHK